VMMKKMVNHKMNKILNNYKRMNHKLSKRRVRKKQPYQNHHPINQITGDKEAGVETRRKLRFNYEHAMILVIEPKCFAESSKSED
jgi:hypothetical protein